MVRIISALILAVTAVCASAAEPLTLVDNPPDRHIVVPGDTLWGISGKFLKQPWRWPDIWQMNKAEVKNPHRIYPGDIIMLDMSSGSPRLKIGKPLNLKAQPKVYSEAVQQIIPSIPSNVIEPFISQPLIIEPGETESPIRIVATQEDRMFLGNGDVAFVTGIPDASVEKWNVFRTGKPLKDPDTGEVIAHEAYFLGNARLVQPGEPAVMRVTLAKQEIGRGDRLLPAPLPDIIAYVPHRPENDVSAKIMSIYGGVSEAGAGSVVTLNRGKNDSLEVGHVLALFRKRVSVGLDDNGRRVRTPIPEERYALAFIFRVFDRVAYALVVESSKAVMIGDAAKNP
ncbi:LysM peptidoglycan-binding domain-containing protein [Dechloromonas sp. TW-R-39-2]|uniref:LysM peptidoglycan-binding domain-containing protein n=1 Tax=Dechloromonas sp. TW-R-39-2 TaxID=2654218 RepID=UPI00193D8621|nr:LysM peptidoglycan-binding domain-containing protein [Dechloromonas sp. TW-R-39-2]QRM18232.1 LysM peptidoglycan-binding domain-containing protein [Dechloromonas sp. TW-R-39-2]